MDVGVALRAARRQNPNDRHTYDYKQCVGPPSHRHAPSDTWARLVFSSLLPPDDAPIERPFTEEVEAFRADERRKPAACPSAPHNQLFEGAEDEITAALPEPRAGHLRRGGGVPGPDRHGRQPLLNQVIEDRRLRSE